MATKIGVGPASIFRIAGKVEGSAPDVAQDPNFDGLLTETHADSVIYRIPVIASPTAVGMNRLLVTLRYQGCNERYCLQPVTDSIFADIRLAGAALDGARFDSATTPAVTGLARPSRSRTVPSQGQPTGNGSLGLFLWIGAGMGALSLLTPCVFPMVP